MILIISELYDKTTDLVLEWYNYYGVDTKRLNIEDCSNSSIKLSNSLLSLDINNNSNFKVWLRRGRLQLIPDKLKQSSFNSNLRKEERPIFEFIEWSLKREGRIVGSYQEESLNNS